MSEPSTPPTEPLNPATRTAVEAILTNLSRVDGIQSLVVIDRLGAPLASRGGPEPSHAVLYAMAAALAGAGHAAVSELEESPDVRVVARSDRTRIHVAGIDEEHLLVTVASNEKPWAGIRPHVNDARKTLRERIASESRKRPA